MKNDLGDLRKSYQKGALDEAQIPSNPVVLFDQWFLEAANHDGVDEVNAMTLSTSDTDGFPGSRVVLLKGYNVDGFTFYTNYNSRKGRAIESNSRVCLSFFWPALERQIIIKGEATKISDAESLAYFESRPRGSQIGAHASSHSEEVLNRDFLEEQLDFYENKFKGEAVPKPVHWGGYLVRAQSFEFWQGRDNRLHDRIVFVKDGQRWRRMRLAP